MMPTSETLTNTSKISINKLPKDQLSFMLNQRILEVNYLTELYMEIMEKHSTLPQESIKSFKKKLNNIGMK